MKLDLPKIYPITDTGLSGLSHADQVRRMIDGGATFIQLRDKVASSGEFYRAAADVVRLTRNTEVRIIINDRLDIALMVGAGGVHLGQNDIPPVHARELLGADAVIGFSTHSVEQARAAVRLPVDYVAFGPIFTTSTKIDPDPPVGLDTLRQVRDAIGDFPLVAIGGISRDNAIPVLSAGADSVAMISDIVSDPTQITDGISRLIQAANAAG